MIDMISNMFNDSFLPTSELFRNVLNASFQGSIVILIVLLLRLTLKKAPKKYLCLLWILVGVRLLCPFTFESRLSLQPEEPVVTQQVWDDLRDFGRIMPEDGPTEPLEVYVPEEDEKPLPDDYQPHPEVTVTTTVEITPVMAAPYLWMAGITVLAAYSLISYLLLKRRVRQVAHLFENVWECAGIDTAFILGFWNPQIYLPVGLNVDSQRFILNHEQTHLARGDHWVKLIGFMAVAVHWFNPLVWLAYSLLCRDVEMACDERVIRDMGLEERKRYSAALLECSANRVHWAACPVAFGEVSVKQRILSVLHYRKPAFWLSVIAVVAVIFVAVCFLTDPSGEERIPSTNEDWEAEIRAVLEEIQSRDYYHILEERQFEGEYILNDNSQRNAFRSGDTWLRIDYIEDAYSFSGYMGIQGRYYDAVSDTDRFEWREVDMTTDAIFDPWLYSFDIDAQEVTANAMWTDDGSYYIRLMVHAPYGGDGWLNADSYYVDFGFDSDGNFKHAIQYVNTTDMIDGKLEDHSMVVTMCAPDIPEVDIQSTIEVYAGTLNPDVETIWGSDSAEETQPDWGLTLTATDVSPSGVTLVCERKDGEWPGYVMTGRPWWLEKWTGQRWEIVEPVQNLVWAMDAQLIGMDTTARWDCSFVLGYGTLEPGSYRIGKDFSNVAEYKVGIPQSAKEITCEYYAEFVIEATDPLTRCETALKAFQAQETGCVITSWTDAGAASMTEHYYWDGDDCLYQALTGTMETSFLEKNDVWYTLSVKNVSQSIGDSGWVKSEAQDEGSIKPWLHTFAWEEAETQLLRSEDSDTVTLTVAGSPSVNTSRDVDSYTVRLEFYPGSDTLRNVVLSYDYLGRAIVAEMNAQAMAPEDAAATIERIYDQEIAQ